MSRYAALTLVFAFALAAGATCSANAVRLGAGKVAETRRWIDKSLPANALVESRVEYANNEGPFYDAAVTFTSDDGREIRATVRQTVNGEFVRDPQVGKAVKVRYDRAAPTDVKLASRDELWFNIVGVLVGMSVALLLCLVGLGHIALYLPEYLSGRLWRTYR